MQEGCIGCDGKGWVQVIDPVPYQSVSDNGSTNAIPIPQFIISGVARAVTCPLCKGIRIER